MAVITILGASVRAAVHSALGAGLSPFGIDLFADQDLAAVCPVKKISRYPFDFAAALAAAPAGPWLYTGGLENYPRLVDRLATIRPLLGNRGAALRAVRDPRQLAIAASSAGCPMPQKGDSPKHLLKPRRGSGGVAIRFAGPDERLRPPRGWFLQEYIAGEPASAVFVAAQGHAQLLGVTRQLLGSHFQLARPFLYVGSVGPLPLGAAEQAAVARLGNELTRRFGLQGLFNVDFVRASGTIRTIEVNPRYSASVEVLERATGTLSIPLHLAACQDNTLTASAPPARRSVVGGKAVVYAERDFTMSEKLSTLIAAWNAPGFPPRLADLPRAGDPIQSQQPVLTVFAEGPTCDEVEGLLRHRIQFVKEVLFS